MTCQNSAMLTSQMNLNMSDQIQLTSTVNNPCQSPRKRIDEIRETVAKQSVGERIKKTIVNTGKILIGDKAMWDDIKQVYNEQ